MFLNKSKAAAVLLLCAGALAAAQDQAEKNAPPSLDKAIKAMGGEAKLAKFKAGSAKGKLAGKIGGQEISIDATIFWQGLDRIRMEGDAKVGGQEMKVIIVLNGENA